MSRFNLKRFSGLGIVFLALVVLVVIWVVGQTQADPKSVVIATTSEATPGNIYSYAKLFDNIAWHINSKYVEEVDPKKMIYAGIKGMLEVLDPFSDMLEKKAYDRLMESTHGKYEGLGMSIDSRDGWITVITPMEGTPAFRMGIQAGDRIVEIDGKPTKGMTTEDASRLMRGPKGTEVILKIQREGLGEGLEYKIKRDVIQLKSVPFYGVIPSPQGKIGYVRLSTFSEDATKELREAIKSLKDQNIDGLIFDLRWNGGGLLNQAVQVASLFLGKNKLLVYTQGRTDDQEKKFFSQGEPVYSEGPLVVLVDGQTASASEIVAGAIQDWDRGVVIGDTTFGKGLVQQLYEMSDEITLKLTTAKYYIPSGRCIQKPERSKKNSDLFMEEESGEPDSSSTEEAPAMFFTNAGRIVYGGGGIVPDVVLGNEILQPMEINLERKQLFFDFAVKYSSNYKDIPKTFEADEQVLAEFREFLKEKKFDYKTPEEIYLDTLEEVVKREEKLEFYKSALANLRELIAHNKELDFDKSQDYIKRSIKRDILTKLYGEKGYYEEVVLKGDTRIKKALEILSGKNDYRKILKG
ncbi:MAG TPA: S41 family peptidase [candidate division Zixibacteria bacterium]|nr:S41 family peptidase [candidate division Zixibacteria bacterium]